MSTTTADAVSPETLAVPLSLHAPSKSPPASDDACGWLRPKRSRNTSDETPVSATFASERSFEPSRSSDAGTRRLMR